MYRTDSDKRAAVVVFPHHFGPSTNTAPVQERISCSSESAILGMYSRFFMTII